jgi:hypothetical protein
MRNPLTDEEMVTRSAADALVAAYKDELARLRSKVADLAWSLHLTRVRLLRYGHHPTGCRLLVTGDCDCGWPEVRAEVTAAPPSEHNDKEAVDTARSITAAFGRGGYEEAIAEWQKQKGLHAA